MTNPCDLIKNYESMYLEFKDLQYILTGEIVKLENYYSISVAQKYNSNSLAEDDPINVASSNNEKNKRTSKIAMANESLPKYKDTNNDMQNYEDEESNSPEVESMSESADTPTPDFPYIVIVFDNDIYLQVLQEYEENEEEFDKDKNIVKEAQTRSSKYHYDKANMKLMIAEIDSPKMSTNDQESADGESENRQAQESLPEMQEDRVAMGNALSILQKFRQYTSDPTIDIDISKYQPNEKNSYRISVESVSEHSLNDENRTKNGKISSPEVVKPTNEDLLLDEDVKKFERMARKSLKVLDGIIFDSENFSVSQRDSINRKRSSMKQRSEEQIDYKLDQSRVKSVMKKSTSITALNVLNDADSQRTSNINEIVPLLATNFQSVSSEESHGEEELELIILKSPDVPEKKKSNIKNVDVDVMYELIDIFSKNMKGNGSTSSSKTPLEVLKTLEMEGNKLNSKVSNSHFKIGNSLNTDKIIANAESNQLNVDNTTEDLTNMENSLYITTERLSIEDNIEIWKASESDNQEKEIVDVEQMEYITEESSDDEEKNEITIKRGEEPYINLNDLKNRNLLFQKSACSEDELKLNVGKTKSESRSIVKILSQIEMVSTEHFKESPLDLDTNYETAESLNLKSPETDENLNLKIPETFENLSGVDSKGIINLTSIKEISKESFEENLNIIESNELSNDNLKQIQLSITETKDPKSNDNMISVGKKVGCKSGSPKKRSKETKDYETKTSKKFGSVKDDKSTKPAAAQTNKIQKCRSKKIKDIAVPARVSFPIKPHHYVDTKAQLNRLKLENRSKMKEELKNFNPVINDCLDRCFYRKITRSEIKRLIKDGDLILLGGETIVNINDIVDTLAVTITMKLFGITNISDAALIDRAINIITSKSAFLKRLIFRKFPLNNEKIVVSAPKPCNCVNFPDKIKIITSTEQHLSKSYNYKIEHNIKNNSTYPTDAPVIPKEYAFSKLNNSYNYQSLENINPYIDTVKSNLDSLKKRFK